MLHRHVVAAGALLSVFFIPTPRNIAGTRGGDPLATELARAAAYLRDNTATDALWKDIRENSERDLARAQKALVANRRLLALLRLPPLHESLSAARYVGARTPAQRKETAAFEAEWKRVGAELRTFPASARPLDDIQPALLRAMAEAARPQARIYYDASLEYGRNTEPDSGLYYLGAALAAGDFEDVARRLSEPATGKAPALRALAGEIDDLEDRLLAAYRPPLSIDSHGAFITASAALKEARELDAAGLRHGALLRYLLAAMRLGAIDTTPVPSAAAITARLRASEAAWPRGIDHSIGRVFIEAAEADLAEPNGGATARAIADDVLLRYAAALQPAAPRPSSPPAGVTVTLVRWPYT
jgi:hypothetical protein